MFKFANKLKYLTKFNIHLYNILIKKTNQIQCAAENKSSTWHTICSTPTTETIAVTWKELKSRKSSPLCSSKSKKTSTALKKK